MDTLVAGYRRQTDGPVSEALITTEDPSGKVGIELAVFDENSTDAEGLVARSFIALPAALMDRIADAWKDAHPSGIADEKYGELETSMSASSGDPAAKFLSSQL